MSEVIHRPNNDGLTPISYSNSKPNVRSLQAEVDGLNTRMAEITKMPKNIVRSNVTISNQFPAVTLAEVVALNPDANLNDSADWYTIQSFINDCARNKTKTIRIPEGIYYLSKGIDLSNLEYGTFLNCEGVIFKATTNLESVISLKHNGNYWKGRRLTLKGLEIRGDYLASKGIDIQGTQEWMLEQVRIHECFVGLSLADVWYGEVSNETIIQDCLIGIDFAKGTTAEVNTIGFYNVKFNFAASKTNFYPKNDGETNEEYNNRIESNAIILGIILGGISFNGITVEGYDNAFKYKPKSSGNGKLDGIFSIKDSYFEALKKRIFDFSEASTTGYHQAVYNLTFVNNRIHDNGMEESILTEGEYTFLNNQHITIWFKHGIRWTRLFAEIDKHVTISDKTVLDAQMIIKQDSIPSDINPYKYRQLNSLDPYPTRSGMLPSIQDKYGLIYYSRLRLGDTAFSPYLLGVHTKPLTFIGNDYPVGPVITGNDGNYYMITTKDGTSIDLLRITNTLFLEPTPQTKTARELYRRPSENGETFRCLELERDVQFNEGKWTGIGKGSELANISGTPNTWFSSEVWNVEINRGYNWQSSYWAWGRDVYQSLDTTNSKFRTRAIGTLAQRPASGFEGFIYYAADENKYYQWNTSDNSYIDYTPTGL